MLKVYRVLTHLREDLRGIVSNRVLPIPILQHKDHDGDNEPDEVTLPKERFASTQSAPRSV